MTRRRVFLLLGLSAACVLAFLVLTWPLAGWRFSTGVLLLVVSAWAERALARGRGYVEGYDQGRFDAGLDASLAPR